MTNKIVQQKYSRPNNPKQLKRLISSFVIVVTIFLCIFIIQQVQSNVERFVNINSSIDCGEHDYADDTARLPAKFQEEIFAVAALTENSLKPSDIKVSDSKNIIGFECQGCSNKVAQNIKAQMQTRGWCFLSSGNDNILSAQKEKGKYRYAYIQVFEIEDCASVVITIN